MYGFIYLIKRRKKIDDHQTEQETSIQDENLPLVVVHQTEKETPNKDENSPLAVGHQTEQSGTTTTRWFSVDYKTVFHNFIYATFFMYCYFKPVKGPTRFYCIIYYSLFSVEAIFLMNQEIFYSSESKKWYQVWFSIISLGGFILGIILIVCVFKCTTNSNLSISGCVLQVFAPTGSQ